MFRKLVSNLPYCPALIEDIGFYAKRLKQEEITRRSSFIVAALAVAIQSFAVFSPPEAANASSEQDIIRGGVNSLEDLLVRYERNEEDIKDIYSAAGVTKKEILSTKQDSVRASGNIYMLSRYGQLSSSEKEISMPYPKSTGGTGVRYFSPITSVADQGAKFRAWVGQSSSLGWFAILQTNGSLVTKGTPIVTKSADTTNVSTSKSISIRNISQNVDGNIFTANSNDEISYSIKQTNNSDSTVSTPFTVRLGDLLEYSSLIDSGGGNFDAKNMTLSWPTIDLIPKESQYHTFTIKMLAEMPATATGISNPASYDCNLSVVFGNKLETPVACPPLKGVEGFLYQLPSIGTGPNMLFAALLLVTILFFYFRARQQGQEIKMVRHNFNTGSL